MNCQPIQRIKQVMKEGELSENYFSEYALQQNHVLSSAMTYQFNLRFIINETNCTTIQLRINSSKGDYNQFQIESPIGSGDSNKCFRAIQKITQLPFAIKIIPIQHLFDQYSPLRKELGILKSLNCESCIRIHDQFIDSRNVYLVMEYMKFGTLHNYLIRQEERLSENRIKEIMLSLFESVIHIHQMGIVHRDLKPQNILIRDLASMDLVIGEFGLAEYCTKQGLNTVCGSKEFMAPEMLKGEIYDFKVDVFSLGAICHLLFHGSEIRKTQYYHYSQDDLQMSEEAQDFLIKCTETNPNKRISAKEAIQHPWFDANIIDLNILKESRKNTQKREHTSDNYDNEWLINDEGSYENNEVSTYQRKINTMKH